MSDLLRIAMAQINSSVGDFEGNKRKIIDCINRSKCVKTDIIAFPELAITGYPPQDLLFNTNFIETNLEILNEIILESNGITVIIGFVDKDECGNIYNSAAIISDKTLNDTYHKMHLPNYGVFDEKRYFSQGTDTKLIMLGDTRIGNSICEDICHPKGPILEHANQGAKLTIYINGSPYHAGKKKVRENLLKSQSSNHKLFVGYINMVGGQDELVFDGNSMLFNPDGEIIAQANQFEEDLVFTDLKIDQLKYNPQHSFQSTKSTLDANRTIMNNYIHLPSNLTKNKPILEKQSFIEYDGTGEIYAALVLGTKDYVHKCGFKKTIVALSGGIDSSLVTTIAVDALGIDNVTAISLPSKYSSKSSIDDAELLSSNLGIKLLTIPINPSVNVFTKTLESHLENINDDLTDQNVQSRIRGLIMMALSNNSGSLVLTTGNKSEMAVGYATIYGDMAGGYSVIKDVPKTLVYKLAYYRNTIGKPVIPTSVLLKAPSAELKPNQKDQDFLPEYDVLDEILKEYIENDNSPIEISEKGFPLELVDKIIAMVDRYEYKRQQAAPGIKITSKNFGRDRRMPISNRFRIN